MNIIAMQGHGDGQPKLAENGPPHHRINAEMHMDKGSGERFQPGRNAWRHDAHLPEQLAELAGKKVFDDMRVQPVQRQAMHIFIADENGFPPPAGEHLLRMKVSE
ncbi:MAG: hypothetical protein WDO70_11010 [Alphaproteobacteria bacterium]